MLGFRLLWWYYLRLNQNSPSGIGGQLPRLEGVTLLHVTDGAPEDMEDAHRLGFQAREDYATAREGEIAQGLRLRVARQITASPATASATR